MTVLFITHPRFADHDPGHGHPERPERLEAVLRGINRAGLTEALERCDPRPATPEELGRVHEPALLKLLERVGSAGGGHLDADTAMNAASYEAALLAAGAGLAAVERLDAGAASAAFCAVRPPGHHATPDTSMGFCLLNNVAVTAAALAARGERVLVVDFDAHHGNGTQDAFWSDPSVAYVSMHQHPLYPGTGDLHEIGGASGRGLTANVPLPPGATGDVYRSAVDLVVGPLAERLAPTWLLISAGFDGHRADPLTDLGLTSGDFADLTTDLVALVPADGRVVAFLEGGYDLEALSSSAGACVAALAGERWAPETASSGGPGRHQVRAAALVHRSQAASDPPDLGGA